MTTLTVEKIQYVREKTGCGVKSAKLALIKAKGDQEKALNYFVGGTLIRDGSEPDYQELYRKEVLYKEVVLMKEIEGLERAISVLTGSNPEWKKNVSKGDAEIVETIIKRLNGEVKHGLTN